MSPLTSPLQFPSPASPWVRRCLGRQPGGAPQAVARPHERGSRSGGSSSGGSGRPGGGARRATRAPAGAAPAAAAGGQLRQPRSENVAGDFYVDHTCIDCDTCRWMAPASFTRVGNMSAVTQQPRSREERVQAMQALLSCPTFSIHCRHRQPGELRDAQQSFPLLVPGCSHVFRCGFAAESSFGATSYFIRRPQGNILVDVPRWTPLLAQRLQQLGGVRWIFLTHRDDVGDHAAWAAHTGARRIIHRLEVSRRQGTDQCEVLLEGEGPWRLTSSSSSSGGSSVAAADSSSSSGAASAGGPCKEGEGGGEGEDDDVQLLFTPGHTPGCLSLLYSPDRALFTGDHLAYSQRLGRLTIFRAYNWHSVAQQLGSVHALLGDGSGGGGGGAVEAGAGASPPLDFLHVLPGHGRAASFADAADRERQLRELLQAEGYYSGQSAGRI